MRLSKRLAPDFYPLQPLPGGPPSGAASADLLNSPAWICQPKLDGVRMFWDGHALWTRNGTRVERDDIARHLGAYRFVDGELMPDGTWHVWDAVLCGRTDLRYIERYRALERTDGPWVFVPETTPQEALLSEHEGVVFKRKAAPYKVSKMPRTYSHDMIKSRFAWEV